MTHSYTTFACSVAALCSVIAGSQAIADDANSSNEWRFNVSLDGKPIGYHRFQLNERGPQQELHSEARFNVKFLFVNVYSYTHDDRELWHDGCLEKIDTGTDDNGTSRSVHGTLSSSHFVVEAGKRTEELSHCILTFAYWNPQILNATHLLNQQTGEYIPVSIALAGTDSVFIQGITQRAERYHLVGNATIGGELQIDLWYSANKEWLALESVTENGHVLRYQIQ